MSTQKECRENKQIETETEWKMWNKTLRNTDRHEERQGSGGERDNGMKERSCKGRHADGQIYR